MLNLHELFNTNNKDHSKFEKVENKLHTRPDICAFILLDKLCPNSGRDIISAASHDVIYLDIDCDNLAETASESDILTLIRCGVMYSKQYNCLSMFV